MWWLCAVTSIAVSDLVINEVHFDPPGPDAGYEFLEIFNPAEVAVPLAGVRVVFINGTSPDHPDEVWAAEPATTLEAGGFFVLGGQFVPARDRTVTLGLQNGDEAVELWRDAVRVDVVAWGDDLGLGEGSPVDGTAGRAVGRVPDGRDTDANAADFRELPEPTPGRVNLPPSDFALVGWWTDPVWREDAGELLLHLEVLPTGYADLQTGILTVGVEAHALRASSSDTLRFTSRIHGSPGPIPVEVRLGSTEVSAVPVGPAELWCGVRELVFTEVQPRPLDGEPEWVEILNRGTQAVPLAGWALRDRGGSARRLADEGDLPGGERIVFCSDALEMRRFYPDSPARFVEPIAGWPSLNDTGPAAGVAADSLHLIAPDGTVLDLVTWRRDDIEERGRSLQRGAVREGIVSIWMPAISGPGPGEHAGEESRSWPGQGIQCGPDPFTPDADGVDDELEVLLVGDWSSPRAAVFDLQGDLVRELELVGTRARHAARWDGNDGRGRPVPAGAWVVVVEAADEAGVVARMRSVIGLGRRP